MKDRPDTRKSNEGEIMSATELWTYRESSHGTMDLSGFEVEAQDGSIGKVDEASNEVGASYIVVDTGPWIFGKKVLLPAGVIARVDTEDEKVYVDRTKDEIKNAPEFDESNYRDTQYRDELGGYYGSGREDRL
jgi:ribosomal 30S subunit maturation factor RimM